MRQAQAVLILNFALYPGTSLQASNFSWFGYPDDTVPSSRDFVPGLSQPPSPGPRASGRPFSPKFGSISSATLSSVLGGTGWAPSLFPSLPPSLRARLPPA
eukprot:scaffold551428_cov32-Prasinocladus_malaysianus.AAC.2